MLRSRSRKFRKGRRRSRSRTFHLRLRNPAGKIKVGIASPILGRLLGRFHQARRQDLAAEGGQKPVGEAKTQKGWGTF